MLIEQIIEFLETDTLSAAFSALGLEYLALGNGEHSIINLRSYFEFKPSDPMINMLINETVNFLQTGSHNMVLDLTAFTPFQRAVFDAVGQIPAGSIKTYKDLAVRLGKPGGARAVGSAISKNPVAYFIPTHRVLPQAGIGVCRSGAGFLREKLLIHEGHDIKSLRQRR
ncbi:MAG: MGMT family protein [Firmicutes bacterium]|nr:MGMT family protein [Bacillota bacterium]